MADDSREFLRLLFEHKPDDLYILLWEKLKKNTSYWFKSWEHAADAVAGHRTNLYVGLALSPTNNGPHERCKGPDTAGLAGLGADTDLAGPAHATKLLPKTEADALWLLNDAFEPSIITRTGHGLQGLWLFKEPEIFTCPEDRAKAATVALKWDRYLKYRAVSRGWSNDSTFDLARVFRVPGTINWKPPHPNTEASILSITDRRYTLREFAEFVDGIPALSVDIEKEVRRQVPPPVGGFTYDWNAEVEPVLFKALWENDLNFRLAWSRKRPDLKDQSQSSYDAVLANICWLYEIPDQQTVDLLVHHRRLHKQKPKCNPVYYYQHTLEFARRRRQPRSDADTKEAIDAVLTGQLPGGEAVPTVAVIEKVAATTPPPEPQTYTPGAEAEPDEPPPDPRNEKVKEGPALDAFNTVINMHIKGVPVKVAGAVRIRAGKDTTWRLNLSDGQIVMLDKAIQWKTYDGFDYQIGTQVNGSIAILGKRSDWQRKAVPWFQLMLIDEDSSPVETTDIRGTTTELIDAYLSNWGVFPEEFVFEAAKHNGLPFLHEERIAIYAKHVVEWAVKFHGEKITHEVLTSGLSAIKANRKTIYQKKGRTTQSRYLLPQTWDADTYRTQDQRNRMGGDIPKPNGKGDERWN